MIDTLPDVMSVRGIPEHIRSDNVKSGAQEIFVLTTS